MRPCGDCPLAIDGPMQFGTDVAEAINVEVERQLGGDSLRDAGDPTSTRIMGCAALVAVRLCGNFARETDVPLHLQVRRQQLDHLELKPDNPYL